MWTWSGGSSSSRGGAHTAIVSEEGGGRVSVWYGERGMSVSSGDGNVLCIVVFLEIGICLKGETHLTLWARWVCDGDLTET